jgi:hypothetical protein
VAPRVLHAAVVALAVLAGPAPAAPPTVPVETPQGQLALALTDLSVRVGPEDAVFTRYKSFFTVPADPQLAKALGFPMGREDFKRAYVFWVNHLNASRTPMRFTDVPAVGGLVEVPGSAGTLYRFDLRHVPNWTRAAFNLVADRDHIFRETPLGPLPHRETVFGRLVTGIEVNDKTFAAGFIVDAYQLFRDSMEGDRTQTYYDLLYGKERHPDPDDGKTFLAPAPGPEPQPPAPQVSDKPVQDAQGKWHPAGTKYVDGGLLKAYQEAHDKWEAAKAKPPAGGQLLPKRPISVRDANKGVANFPATLKDFRKRWGGEIGAEELKAILFDPTVGGIALAADSDPTRGSIVAVGGDRAVFVVETRDGFYAQTDDVKKNQADKDPHEQFLNVVKQKYKPDGGEALGSLPNGAQAGFLFNAQEARVEIADTDLARIREPKIDPRYQDVRTMMGCVACHAPSGGFNTFIEQFEESLRLGVKFKVRAEDAQLVDDFFRSWKKRVSRWQGPYQTYVAETTAGPDGKAWSGQKAWEVMRAARDWYDRPVRIEVAAREYGLPVEVFRQRLLGVREADSPIDVRLNQLTVGKAVPRRTWDDEVFGKASLFLDSVREREEPIKQLLADELIRDALKKFGHKEVSK